MYYDDEPDWRVRDGPGQRYERSSGAGEILPAGPEYSELSPPVRRKRPGKYAGQSAFADYNPLKPEEYEAYPDEYRPKMKMHPTMSIYTTTEPPPEREPPTINDPRYKHRIQNDQRRFNPITGAYADPEVERQRAEVETSLIDWRQQQHSKVVVTHLEGAGGRVRTAGGEAPRGRKRGEGVATTTKGLLYHQSAPRRQPPILPPEPVADPGAAGRERKGRSNRSGVNFNILTPDDGPPASSTSPTRGGRGTKSSTTFNILAHSETPLPADENVYRPGRRSGVGPAESHESPWHSNGPTAFAVGARARGDLRGESGSRADGGGDYYEDTGSAYSRAYGVGRGRVEVSSAYGGYD